MKYHIEEKDWKSFLNNLETNNEFNESKREKLKDLRLRYLALDNSHLNRDWKELSNEEKLARLEVDRDKLGLDMQMFYEEENTYLEFDKRRSDMYKFSTLLCLQLSESVSELKKTIEELKIQEKKTSVNSIKNRNIIDLGFGAFVFLCVFIYLVFNYLYEKNSYYSERNPPIYKIEKALKALKTVILDKKEVNNEDNEQWITKPEFKPKISAPEEYINAVQMDSIQNRIDAFELKKMDNDSLN